MTTTTPTPPDMPELKSCQTGAWYVKDFADGWIKYYDLDMAVDEAKRTGAIMKFSFTAPPRQQTRCRQRGEASVHLNTKCCAGYYHAFSFTIWAIVQMNPQQLTKSMMIAIRR